MLTKRNERYPLLIIVVFLIHVAGAHNDYGIPDRLAAGVAAALIATVIFSYLERKIFVLPVLEWVLFQVYVFFVMPVFFQGIPTRVLSFEKLEQNASIFKALLAAMLFITFLLFGWKFVRKFNFNTFRSKGTTNLRPLFLFLYGIICLVVSYLLDLYEYQIKISWFRSVLTFLFSPTVAQLMLIYELITNKYSSKVVYYLYIFTGLFVAKGLLTGRLSYPVIALVACGIGIVLAKGRIPKSIIIVTLLILVVYNPVKITFRQLTGYRTDQFQTLSVSTLVDAWVTSFEEIWDTDKQQQSDALGTVTDRLNNLSLNALVIDTVPERIEFSFFESWLAIPQSVIPRFLWPDKPNMTHLTNDRFSITFGLTTWNLAERTTKAYPSIADGYWSFGWLGVALSGFITGIFWGFVYFLWTTGGRVQFVISFYLLMQTMATVAVPNLIIGTLQVAIACVLVVKTFEICASIRLR